MNIKEFRKAGHTPSLVAGLAHFDVSFMCWVILGALGTYIAEDLALSPAEKGLLVAVPLLSAAFFRITLGILSDRFGPARVGTISMAFVSVPLLWGWLGATSLNQLFAIGAMLGVAGASFAISLPLASRWYPPKYQGVVLGIAGAGNSGTVIAALAAPRLAEHYGWHAVMGLALIPVALVLLAFVIAVKEPPLPKEPISLRKCAGLFSEPDAWRFCAFYTVSFGSFVGLASFLPIFYHDQYGISKVDAATLTAVAAAAGSLLRPVGGALADRFGGSMILGLVYVGAATILFALSGLPSLALAAALFAGAMGLLGIANGSVFQLVAIRFPERIGLVTGVVGAAGGVGGFMLPTILGVMKQTTGSYGSGLAVIAAAVITASAGVALSRRTWRSCDNWTPILAEARV